MIVIASKLLIVANPGLPVCRIFSFLFNKTKNHFMKLKMSSLFQVVAALSFVIISCNNESAEKTKEEDTTSAMKQEEPKMEEEAGVMVGGAKMVPSKDIVDNAINSADHTTLVAAVKAAGLVETLKGAGPFTVFAPTNEAFAKLPAGTIDNLIKPGNKAKLTSILTYHVVPGAFRSTDLKDGQMFKTVQGEELSVWNKMANG